MRTIRVKNQNWHIEEYKEDISRIQNALIDKGFFATNEQCAQLWELYSETEWAAGWLVMNDLSKDEIYDCVRKYFEPGPESSLDTKYI